MIRLTTVKPYCTFGYQSRSSSSLMIFQGNGQQHLNEDFHVAVLQHAAAERKYSRQKESNGTTDSIPTFTTSFYAKTITILH